MSQEEIYLATFFEIGVTGCSGMQISVNAMDQLLYLNAPELPLGNNCLVECRLLR